MPAEDAFSYTLSANVMVPMRDGVRLATDIYRPALADGNPHPGPLPAILVRTSYDKSSPSIVVEPIAKFFIRHGYAVISQDLRGRGMSEGTGQYFHMANANEGTDGYDTIEWISTQVWCNGRVGMTGPSHLGVVQNVAALHRPPHLRAIWADVAPTKVIDGTSREGGAMALHMFGAMFLHGFDAQEIRDDLGAQRAIEQAVEKLGDQVMQIPFRPGTTPLAAIPAIEQTLFRYYWNGTYDEWWSMETMDLHPHIHRFADIPVTLSSGWYDPFAKDAIWQFMRLRQQNHSPTRLVVGPWNHLSMRTGQSHVGEVDFGADASWGKRVFHGELLRWFDRWLKDSPTEVENEPPVRYFVMGGGSGERSPEGRLRHGGNWRATADWPPLTEAKTLYLTAAGSLQEGKVSDDTASLSWTHDPEHPVPTLGAAVTGFYRWALVPEDMDRNAIHPRARMRSLLMDGPMHQRERQGVIGCRPPFPLLAARPDVLVFQTPPLADELTIIGSVVLTLFISSDAVDTDVTAKLIDVYPRSEDWSDGFHMNLADTILRGRFRNGLKREQMMEPGHVYRFELTLPPVANWFLRGHRIRLDVASSNFPRFDVNPGTGERLGRHTFTRRARNTLHTNSAFASQLVLPIQSP